MKKICTNQLYKGGIDVSEFRFPLYSLKKCFCLLINKLKTQDVFVLFLNH